MITIKRIRINENPDNEVTSDKIFRPRKIRDADGNFLFDENGIFSERIFGKFNKCKCGALTKPGICKYCGVRVLNKKRMPDFYISFKDLLDIPYLDINPDFADKKLVTNLFNYRGFLYNGEYHELDLKDDDLTKYDTNKILIGRDAILSLGATEEWYQQQVHDKLSVPHTSLRKITDQNGQYYLGTLNTIFVDILKKKTTLIYYFSLAAKDIFFELNVKKYLLEQISKVYDALFEMIAKGKNSVLAREIRGQGLTGIIRAVITNNFDIDEDCVIIGKYFIKTLYPKIYEMFTTKEFGTDIKKINEYLRDHGYYVLVNRQPTIGAKSIMGMIPVFSDKDSEKYVIQLNPIVMEGFAGDFDGDVLSVTALYTKEACNEAKMLLPSVNYIEGSNGTIRNCIPEDLQYAMQNMYDKNYDECEKIHHIINS